VHVLHSFNAWISSNRLSMTPKSTSRWQIMKIELIVNIHDEYFPNAIAHGLERRIRKCGIGERQDEEEEMEKDCAKVLKIAPNLVRILLAFAWQYVLQQRL
jgi:hypothetical protein